MNKRVAVIIPAYNCEKYIGKCIRSILNQTYANITTICVNDGSQDNTLEVISRFQDKIIIINQKNQGASKARNVGIRRAKELDCDYICFCDADDYFDTVFIERAIDFLCKYNSDIYISSVKFYSTKPTIKYPLLNMENNYPIYLNSYELLLHYVKENMFPVFHGKLFNITFFSNIDVDEKCIIGEDVVTLFNIYRCANGAICDDNVSYYLNRDPNVFSLTRSPNTILKFLSIIRCHFLVLDASYSIEQTFKNREVIIQEAVNIFVYNYLMLFPRIVKRANNKETSDEITKYKKYIKSGKLMHKYIPISKKERLKKYIYIISPLMYKIVYSFFIR